jgi:hypothetical protein
MPQPWLFNQWACSPWATEVDREAAVDTEATSVLPPLTKEDIQAANRDDGIQPGFPSISPAEWQRSLTANWTDVAAVIHATDQIQESDFTEVLDWVNSTRDADKQRSSLHCFDYAHYQVWDAGFGVSGPGHVSPTTLLVLLEFPDGPGVRTQIQTETMVEAVTYMKEMLQAGTPVLIGLRLRLFEERPNERRSTPYIEPTNHFVVAVGMGTDDEGPFISFYDYSHGFARRDRLYLRPDLTMTNSGDYRHLTEVRRSTRR